MAKVCDVADVDILSKHALNAFTGHQLYRRGYGGRLFKISSEGILVSIGYDGTKRGTTLQ